MVKEIRTMDGDLLLNTSPDDLASYLAEKFSIHVPRLIDDQISVDVSHDPMPLAAENPVGKGGKNGNQPGYQERQTPHRGAQTVAGWHDLSPFLLKHDYVLDNPEGSVG